MAESSPFRGETRVSGSQSPVLGCVGETDRPTPSGCLEVTTREDADSVKEAVKSLGVTGRRDGHYSNTEFPAPCRACGGPSWKEDDIGPVHPCCADMWEEGIGCLSCRASEMLNREQRRRGRQRLPKELLADKLAAIGEGKSLQDQEAT